MYPRRLRLLVLASAPCLILPSCNEDCPRRSSNATASLGSMSEISVSNVFIDPSTGLYEEKPPSI